MFEYAKPKKSNNQNASVNSKIAQLKPAVPDSVILSALGLNTLPNKERSDTLEAVMRARMNEQFGIDKIKENRTGIPDNVKDKFESKSGYSFDDVRVHYNSDKPAQFQASAYTQGSEVHIAPGREQSLEHELGHVVQQKSGMVKPTAEISGVPVNDDDRLERAAESGIATSGTPAPNENGDAGKPVMQFVKLQIGERNENQRFVVGLNVIPSAHGVTTLYKVARGIGDTHSGNLCEIPHICSSYNGHTSVMSGVSDGDGVIDKSTARAMGFSPKGYFEKLKLANPLGRGEVVGKYQDDGGLVQDSTATQVVAHVSKETFVVWNHLMENAQGLNNDNEGIYSFAPTTGTMPGFSGGGTDNCTTVALRTAVDICKQIINDIRGLQNFYGGALYEQQRIQRLADVENLSILKDSILDLMCIVMLRNLRANSTRGTNGRLVSALGMVGKFPL